jgi:hypothetical protein
MAVLINSFVPTSAHIVGGQFNVIAPILTDTQCSVLQLDPSGNLKVTFTGGSASNPAAGTTGAPVPASASYTGVNIGGILFGITGLNLTNAVPATVAIVDGSGNQITSFGGGTQYADNTASALPTGTLDMVWDNVGNKVRARTIILLGDNLVNPTVPQVGANLLGWDVGNSVWRRVQVTTNTGTLKVDTGAPLVALSDGLSNPTTIEVGANLLGWDAGNSIWRRVQVDSNSGVLQVDASNGGTVTIAGTVTANQGTNPWITSDNHLPGSFLLADGMGNPTTTQIGANLLGWDAGNHLWNRVQVNSGTGSLNVNIVSGSSSGTQYADDAASGTAPTGTLAMGWDSVNAVVRALKVDPSQNLFVNAIQGVAAAINLAWPVKITDGVRVPAVKAASTAAVPADPALVVALSPNSPATVQYADAVASGTAPTGTLAMGWDFAGQQVRALQVDANQNLKVRISDNASESLVDLLGQILAQVRQTNMLMSINMNGSGDDSLNDMVG